MDKCHNCGMPVAHPAEFHPYAACLMFQACRNSETVMANLGYVVRYGMICERKGIDDDQALHDTRLSRVPEEQQNG